MQSVVSLMACLLVNLKGNMDLWPAGKGNGGSVHIEGPDRGADIPIKAHILGPHTCQCLAPEAVVHRLGAGPLNRGPSRQWLPRRLGSACRHRHVKWCIPVHVATVMQPCSQRCCPIYMWS